MTLLVLYEELAVYFVKCITTLAAEHGIDVHIIHKEVNKEAPFDLKFEGRVKTYSRSQYSDAEIMELVRTINPAAVFCGGWKSKVYMKIAASCKGKIPVVVGFDNKWTGSLKQRIAALIAPFYITNKFDKCFVPGPEQKTFALKMGFGLDKIATGAYSADFDFFHRQYLANRSGKSENFPRRFIFVGRYLEFKGVKDLWRAFVELKSEHPNDWELWCLGAGELAPEEHPSIRHFGFVQPADLSGYIKDAGVFILPSLIEPWGVVVHEFAAAGFPVICSHQVGARTVFVGNNYNGYIYEAGSVPQLKEAMRKIISSDNKELNIMADRSVEKASAITPAKWANQLMKLIYE